MTPADKLKRALTKALHKEPLQRKDLNGLIRRAKRIARTRSKENPTIIRLREELLPLLRNDRFVHWLTRGSNGLVGLFCRLLSDRAARALKQLRRDCVNKLRRRARLNSPVAHKVLSTKFGSIFFSRGGNYFWVSARGRHLWPGKGTLQEAFRLAPIVGTTIPDPNADDRLGVRCFNYCRERRLLISPIREAEWHSRFLTAHEFSLAAAVEGEAGIHAMKVPYVWRGHIKAWALNSLHYFHPNTVVGLVRRHGKAVVGEVGWRAEAAEILELRTTSEEIAAKLLLRYPGARVVVEQERRDE